MMAWRGVTWQRAVVVLAVLARGVAWAEEPRTLRGHDGWISAVAVSPDGQRLFSGGDDGALMQWRLQTAELIGTMRTFPEGVTALACQKDGEQIAVGLHDGRVELCAARDAATTRKFSGHKDTITVVCFDPRSTFLASGSADDSLRIWDIRDGTLLHTFHQGNEYDVVTAALRPDGRRIVTGDGENEMKVWDTGTGAEIETLRGHEGTVTSVVYSPCGKRIVSASWDATLRVWDAETGAHLKTMRGHEADVIEVLFTPDGSRIISASEDDTIRIWDAATYELQRTLPAERVMCLAISPDGRTLVGGGEASIRLWNLAGEGK